MIRAVREWGQKFLKGINIMQHGHDLAALRAHLYAPLSILALGSCVSTALFMVGSWGYIARLMGASFHLSLTSLTLHEYMISLVSVLAVAELARQLFGAKVQSKKYIEWVYVVRYFKGFFLAGAPFALALSLCQFGVDQLGDSLMFYIAQPKTMAVVVWLGCLSVIVLLGCGLILYSFRLSLVFSTYTLAFIMQGRGISESVSKGSRLFNTHWPYVLGLILLFMACATCIEYIFDLYLCTGQHVFASELRGFLLSGLLLLYCALFFSYHRRVSKVPTGR